jgi:hypothetical protein
MVRPMTIRAIDQDIAKGWHGQVKLGRDGQGHAPTAPDAPRVSANNELLPVPQGVLLAAMRAVDSRLSARPRVQPDQEITNANQ